MREHDCMDIFSDLEAEYDRLDNILGELDNDSWMSISGAPGWTVSDVVLHLAQTDEAVVISLNAPIEGTSWRESDVTVDEMVDALVRDQRAEPSSVFGRWRAARRASVAALRAADPRRRFRWAAAPLKPTTLATTRLAEHWAHGLDITGPLGIDYPDTDRLHHIAWLGFSTLPYAFGLEGVEPPPMYCELSGPGGDLWYFGSSEAASRIVGSAGEFCRVGARRLLPGDSQLVASGPHAELALRALRNYAY